MIEFDLPDEAGRWNKLCEDPIYPCEEFTKERL
jgi:hypothetical protein